MGVQIGALHVRRSGVIQATAERVWQEFTSFERLEAWFGRGHKLEAYEPELGGKVRLSVETGAERRFFGGPVLVFEPGRELTFANDWEADGWPVPTLITIRLAPFSDACHVELFHHGFERFAADAGAQHQGYESAWDTRHLEALREIVES